MVLDSLHLQNHCSESKKYQDIVNRFSEFLLQYAQHNREKAAGVLYKNLEVLRYHLCRASQLLYVDLKYLLGSPSLARCMYVTHY